MRGFLCTTRLRFFLGTLCAAGCSSGGAPIDLDDGEPFMFDPPPAADIAPGFMPDAPAPPAPPEPPVAPALPVLTPCPAGWVSELDEAAGVTLCVPWAEPPPLGACPPGEGVFPGTPGCVSVGASCPAGDYAEGLPASGVLFVSPTASAGGAGTALDPMPLGEALGSAAPGTVVALAKGAYAAGVSVPAGVTLRGACARETTLVGAGEIAVTVSAPGVVLRDLTLSHATGAGVLVTADGSLTMNGVSIDGVFQRGIVVEGGAVDAEELLIRNVDGVAGLTPWGVLVNQGGSLSLARTNIEGSAGGGVSVTLASTATLTRVAIRDTGTLMGFEVPTGLAVGIGAQVDATELVITDVGAIGVLVNGATLDVEPLHVERTRPEPAGLLGTGVAAVDGGQVALRRALVRHTRRTGVVAYAAGTELDVEDSVVLDTAESLAEESGRAIDGAGPSTIRLERVLVARSQTFGVRVLEGSALDAVDVTVLDTRETGTGTLGRGLDGTSAGPVTVERLRVVDSVSAALFFHDTEATLRDVTARGVTAASAWTGQPVLAPSGFSLQADADVTVERLSATDLVRVGMIAFMGVRLTGSDILIRDVELPSVGGARGVEIDASAVSVERLVIENATEAALGVQEGASAVLRDLRVAGTRPNANTQALGHGVTVRNGSSLEGARVALTGNHEVALFADLGAVASLTDLTVTDTESGVASARFGRAVSVQQGSTAFLTRALLAGNREISLAAMLESTVTADHIFVRDTAPHACAPGCADGAGVGAGSYEAASLTLRDFRVESNALAGLQLARDGQMALARGVVAGNPVGINVQSTVDFSALTDQVLFLDNGRNADSSILAVPEALTGL